MNSNIELHNESDFILFLKHNEIKLTSEIRLLYYMTIGNMCFVCHHIDSYPNDKNNFESYQKLKAHFIKKHTTDYEGKRVDRSCAEGLSRGDLHDYYSKTEILVWNNNKILGLMDQMIVLENYLDRRLHIRGRGKQDEKLYFYRDLGACIIKIMKDYQIPQLMFTKYLGISAISFEKYTTAYYMCLDDNEKPGWMKAFLKS